MTPDPQLPQPTSKEPPAWAADFQRSHSGGISSVVVGSVMTVAIGAACYFGLRDSQSHDQPAVVKEATTAFHEAWERQIANAIVERRAIFGMTKHQVIQAKGYPLHTRIGPQLNDTERKGGAVETWSYTTFHDDPQWVAFNTHALVLTSSDQARERQRK